MIYSLEEATYPDTKEYDLGKTKFIHAKREFGYSDEPYLEVDGKRYRVRAELLLFNDEGKLFVNPHTSKPRGGMAYSLPGGGIQPNETIEQAAARETEEEALLVPKNVKYSGYHYKIMWEKSNDPIMNYDGMLAFICTGEYDKKYTKYVKKQDRTSLAEKGKWMYPKDISTLSPVHKKVIESYKKSNIQESCEGIYDKDETRYLIENKTKTIKEFYKCLCDNFQYGIVYDKDTSCPKPSSDRINFDKYRTLSVDEMLEYRIGVCWDYVELESYYFKNKFGYDNTVGKLQNKKFSVYYIQFEDKDGDNPTHTWLAYMNNGKVYSFEVSWYTERGIKEFDTETDMIEHYWKIHKEHCSKQCKVYRGLVLKYKPFCLDYNNGFNLDCEQFMDAVLAKGKIIKSEFKEYPVNKIFKNLAEEMDTTFLDTEYVLIESAEYKEAKVVYDSLSEKDKQLCSPKGKYVDSSNIAYRYVHKINNQPIGFIDCYKFNHSNHSAFIILAVHPAYRGKGIGKLMLKKAEENCKLLGFQKLIYRVEKENIPSANLAKKNGYTLTFETKNQYTFIKEL